MITTPILPLLLALSPLLQEPGPSDGPGDRPDVVPVPVEVETQGDASKPPGLPPGLRKRLEDPFAGLQPGSLPEGTEEQAARMFRQLVASSRLDEPGAVQGPVTAFDLAFELIVRGDGVERNQLETRVRYAEPGHLRFQVRDKYEMGFGPTGYWQLMEDGFRELTGRDYASDRRRIVEVRAVCRNFLALAEPRRLRVAGLRLVPGGPGIVPPGLAARSPESPLAWLEVTSPDFDLAIGAEPEDVDPGRLYRATLGIDPGTGRVAEALVQELRDGKPLLSTSTWVTLGQHVSVDGVLLPESLKVRYPDLRTGRLAFEEKVREEMYLLEGHLNPKLEEGAFAPSSELEDR